MRPGPRRRHFFAAAAIVLLAIGSGCSSTGKSNYLRHLSTSLQPSMVTMGDAGVSDESPMRERERVVAAADGLRLPQSH